MENQYSLLVRFGIIGCADIARKISRAILYTPNAAISALGSRSIEKATAFAKENEFPLSMKIYGSYEEVVDDPDVDAVYVPLPTSLHLKWGVLAAQKKKHVLLEKPAALNVKEVDEILEACELNGVQFMDGTFWMHHPRTPKMKDFLSDSHRFGQLKSVHSSFTIPATPEFLKDNIRVKPDLDALGALGDAGWYTISAILWTNDYQLPQTVTALPDAQFNEAGVILSCGASFTWKDGRVATFKVSFILPNWSFNILANGTKGEMRVHDFVWPVSEVASFYTVDKSSGLDAEQQVSKDVPQEALMIKEFSNLVASIKRQGSKPDKKWPTISRKIQVLVDAVKESIDKGFEPVEVVY